MSDGTAAEDDAALLRALGASDLDTSHTAMTRIVHQHEDAIIAEARRLTNRETGDAAAQDIFASLWDRREKLPPISSIRAYLRGALKRYVIQLHRDAETHARRLDDLTDLLPVTVENDAHLHLLLKDLRDAIQEIYTQTSGVLQEIFRLWYYDGRSVNEVAVIMGMSAATVYRYIATIREQIKATLIAKDIVSRDVARHLLDQYFTPEDITNV